ncbi:hypothetical protein Kfla_2475 [Kribbella flavida DSM 17836]|uniref:Uncharacterized protein n=1 Tax=Kribbella flavida (strain DSM 17836 / JCM 10339 / NBRC 14399) TaxID=479435 RepID=D2PW97_KRIFD|nr:hypothetical protein [Kribbella flavida]ADB31549.1 hypothetical protein Kfla_2475 [Kribbella flavida DSM 17836]
MTALPSVAAVRADLPAVLTRFRTGDTHAFSFGDGVPEAVLLTYDEFEDLGGETKFAVGDEVLEPAALAAQLPALLTTLRAGSAIPVVWGTDGEPEAVLLSTSAYRTLRGDDEPPAGVPDDPTQRTYPTEPLPTSRPFDLDEFAEGDPFTQELLREIRADRQSPDDKR